jgi:hypothetical protein
MKIELEQQEIDDIIIYLAECNEMKNMLMSTPNKLDVKQLTHDIIKIKKITRKLIGYATMPTD